jgi:protoporphyrinogen IX oxidase
VGKMYDWLKALHVIAVIAWMAGLLYLPRLFVYHCEAEIGGRQSETFKVMERRLLNAIMMPAMVASWLLGIALIVLVEGGMFASGWWMWAKLLLVVMLSGVHGLMALHTRTFAADRNTRPAVYFRVLNEVPTLLMVGIVILVIVRPF